MKLNGDRRNDLLVIDREFRGLLPKLSDKEYESLENSIIEEGCREPLVAWVSDGQRILIGGHNRFAICKQHGIPYSVVIAENVTGRMDAIIWVLRDQLAKRNLTDYSRAILTLQLEDLIKQQAKKNQLSGLKQNHHSVREKSPERINTREVIAKAAGVSTNTISKVKSINELATEKQIQELEKGTISINRAYQELHTPKNLQDPSKEIYRLIKRWDWAVKKDLIPIGSRLLEQQKSLTPDQKEVISRTLSDLKLFISRLDDSFRDVAR